MRIKCPMCGSTAQIVFTWGKADKCSTIHTREYECGCGCAFEVDFEAVRTKILCLPLDKS